MALDQAVVRDIVRMLCRKSMERGQRVLFKLALENPQKGFRSTEVRKLLDFDQSQQRGLMGALTLRINKSPRELPDSKPGLKLVFTTEWDGEENTYFPRPELIEAIRRIPELTAALARPMAEVLKAPALELRTPADIPVAIPTELAAPPKQRPALDGSPFHDLLVELHRAKLVFPPELIANFLLALQVKRFVILTGISGTGKTQIVQKIAARFPVTARVPIVDVDRQMDVLTLKPYSKEYSRVVVPAALVAQSAVLQDEAVKQIRARWPGGVIDLTISRWQATTVYFRGGLKDWLFETVPVGSPFVLRLESSGDGPPDVLVFDHAPQTRREERIENLAVVAVRPDWTDRRGMLGHFNPLTREYVGTQFLHLLLRASDEVVRAAADKRPPAPFFVLLDEMNLARVEHYFSDFLSALESGKPLQLHEIAEVEQGASIPRQLAIPPNLFFVGTVNVDETTYMFSPKVLDRAFTIELDTVDLSGLTQALQTGGDLDLAEWSGRLDPPEPPNKDHWAWLAAHQEGELAKLVQTIHGTLAQRHRHFGYRVATEIARFVPRGTGQNRPVVDGSKPASRSRTRSACSSWSVRIASRSVASCASCAVRT